MAFKVPLSKLSRKYRDSTNETTSMFQNGPVPAADGSDYQAIRTDLAAALDAMEAFQHADVQLVSETFSIITHDPNGTDIPTDSGVQREAVVTLSQNDANGSTYQRTIPCVDFSVVTLAGQTSDEISPASAEWQGVNTALTAGNIRSSYGAGGNALQSANVGGRNN